MRSNFKSLALASLLVALIAPLCVDWSMAQKSVANSYQQTISSGSRPSSVYGGYETSSAINQQGQSTFVAPVKQQRRVVQQQVEQTNWQRQPAYQQEPQQVISSSSSSSSNYEQSQQAEADAEPASYGSVSGQPGRDFPAYTQVPKTSFSCDGLPYDYGMYADEETGCQAYHVCYNGRKDSFLCGVGTVFNQRILHCDYWYSVECGKSSQYYSSNAYMGSSQPEPGPAQAQSSYKRTEQVSSNTFNRPSVVQQSQSSYSRNVQQVQEAY